MVKLTATTDISLAVTVQYKYLSLKASDQREQRKHKEAIALLGGKHQGSYHRVRLQS